MSFIVYTNRADNAKRFKTWRYYLPKGVIKNYSVNINGKKPLWPTIHPDIKRCQEIRKLKTGQSVDYITGCLWGYEYIKNHYKLIAVDLGRQKIIRYWSKSNSSSRNFWEIDKWEQSNCC